MHTGSSHILVVVRKSHYNINTAKFYNICMHTVSSHTLVVVRKSHYNIKTAWHHNICKHTGSSHTLCCSARAAHENRTITSRQHDTSTYAWIHHTLVVVRKSHYDIIAVVRKPHYNMNTACRHNVCMHTRSSQNDATTHPCRHGVLILLL